MNEIRVDKARLSAPIIVCAAFIAGCVPVIGGYFKFEHRIIELERQTGALEKAGVTRDAAILRLQASDVETEKVIIRINLTMDAMLKSQRKVEDFIDELRQSRPRTRTAGARQ